MRIAPVVLENAVVRLEPYTESLREALRTALDVDRESWDLMATSAYGAAFEAWWAFWIEKQRSGQAACFAVRDRTSDQIVGTTALFDMHPEHRRLEMGATFYRPEARGGSINPACKRLLLHHAFEAGAVRVEILTDALNQRSRAAIARLGAAEEGLLRSHKTTHTGRVRDTVMFSIITSDWPEIRDRLDARLARP